MGSGKGGEGGVLLAACLMVMVMTMMMMKKSRSFDSIFSKTPHPFGTRRRGGGGGRKGEEGNSRPLNRPLFWFLPIRYGVAWHGTVEETACDPLHNNKVRPTTIGVEEATGMSSFDGSPAVAVGGGGRCKAAFRQLSTSLSRWSILVDVTMQ